MASQIPPRKGTARRKPTAPAPEYPSVEAVAVRDEFTRWDGWPKPRRYFASHWCDVDALATEVAQLRKQLAERGS